MTTDSYTEVTSQSWFGRLGNAFKGILFGLILVLISFPLLFWNEGRAVKRYKTLKEGGGAVVSVSADMIDGANQNRLVHLTGLATTEETLADPVFGVTAPAIKLKRIVEMYQWQEESRSEEKKKLGGGTETTTTYTYSKVWSQDPINSGNFKKPEGHGNPGQMPFGTEEITAQTVTVGAYYLSPSLVGKIRDYRPLPLGADYRVPEAVVPKNQVSQDNIYLGNDPASPQIGDLRVSFMQVVPMDISLVAQQVNDTFAPYQAKAGGTIELLENGVHSAEEMFAQAQKSNTILTWVLRAVGFFVMLIGFQLIFAPLSVFADVLPILGSIVSVGTGFVASLIAGFFSLVTIAIAWFVYRPLLGVGLIVVASFLGFVLFKRLRKAPPATVVAQQ